jgi:16S rRNA processing protein RimM
MSKDLTLNDCFELGKILKTHGLRGEVSIFLDVDYPEDYENLDLILLNIEGKLTAFEVEQVRLLPNKPKNALLKLAGIDKIEETEAIIGETIYLPLSVLPQLGEKQFYFHEVIGFQVVDENLGKLATIENVYSFAEGSLLVMFYKGKEVLIPINDETILRVDRQNKIMQVCLPDGLLDVYLE